MTLPTIEDRRKHYDKKRNKPFSYKCYDEGWDDCMKMIKRLNPHIVIKRKSW